MLYDYVPTTRACIHVSKNQDKASWISIYILPKMTTLKQRLFINIHVTGKQLQKKSNTQIRSKTPPTTTTPQSICLVYCSFKSWIKLSGIKCTTCKTTIIAHNNNYYPPFFQATPCASRAGLTAGSQSGREVMRPRSARVQMYVRVTRYIYCVCNA